MFVLVVDPGLGGGGGGGPEVAGEEGVGAEPDVEL